MGGGTDAPSAQQPQQQHAAEAPRLDSAALAAILEALAGAPSSAAREADEQRTLGHAEAGPSRQPDQQVQKRDRPASLRGSVQATPTKSASPNALVAYVPPGPQHTEQDANNMGTGSPGMQKRPHKR